MANQANDQIKIPAWQEESLALNYLFQDVSAMIGMVAAPAQSGEADPMTAEQREHYDNTMYRLLKTKVLMSSELSHVEGYSEEGGKKEVDTGIPLMTFASYVGNATDENGDVIEGIREVKEFIRWISERWQEQADNLDPEKVNLSDFNEALPYPVTAEEESERRKKYAKIREYYQLQADFTGNTEGNYLKSVMDVPYIDRLQSQNNAIPKFFIYPVDEVIDSLNQTALPEKERYPIFDSYMDIVSSGLREIKVDYLRQKYEREGWTPEKEQHYIKELKASHEKTIAAYDRIWEVEDHRQYDEYINNPLNVVCGKENERSRDISYAVGQLRGEVKALENGWGIRDMRLFSYIGGLAQEIKRYKEELNNRLNQAFQRIEEIQGQILNDPQANVRRLEERIAANQDTIYKISDILLRFPEAEKEFQAFYEDAWNRKVTTASEKADVLKQFFQISEKFKEFKPFAYLNNFQHYLDHELPSLQEDLVRETREKLASLQEQGNYRELVDLAAQITFHAMGNPEDLDQARMDGLNQYLSGLMVVDEEGRIPGHSAEVLLKISETAGILRQEHLLVKANAMEEMEKKILRGEVPGTEMLLDYDEKHAGNLQENRDLIRQVADAYVIETNHSAKMMNGLQELTRHIGMSMTDGHEWYIRNQDGEYVEAQVEFLTRGTAAAMEYRQKNLPELTQEKLDRGNLDANDLTKVYGFEINPDAKEGESIFRTVPEDLEKLRHVTSDQELDRITEKAQDDTAKAGVYRATLLEAIQEMKEHLEDLKKMEKTFSSDSDQYKAMENALTALTRLGDENGKGGRGIDTMPIQVLHRRFEEIGRAANTYENSHKGLFKGNFGAGRTRLQFSHNIQTVVQEKLAVLKEQAEGMDPLVTLEDQILNRADAAQRLENARYVRSQARAAEKADAVKDVDLNNLEQKLVVSRKPKVDYKALRAKLQKMQQGAPELKAPVKNGMAVG